MKAATLQSGRPCHSWESRILRHTQLQPVLRLSLQAPAGDQTPRKLCRAPAGSPAHRPRVGTAGAGGFLASAETEQPWARVPTVATRPAGPGYAPQYGWGPAGSDRLAGAILRVIDHTAPSPEESPRHRLFLGTFGVVTASAGLPAPVSDFSRLLLPGKEKYLSLSSERILSSIQKN